MVGSGSVRVDDGPGNGIAGLPSKTKTRTDGRLIKVVIIISSVIFYIMYNTLRGREFNTTER